MGRAASFAFCGKGFLRLSGAVGHFLWMPGNTDGQGDAPGDDGGQGSPKAAVFNRLLTTFLVIAMVWRLTVFWLCSKGYSRRAALGAIRDAGRGWGCGWWAWSPRREQEGRY